MFSEYNKNLIFRELDPLKIYRYHDMKLLIFLGNPGLQYEYTRHNAGFLCADFLQKTENFPIFSFEKKFFGSFTKTGDILFLKPETFMNMSGKAVLALSQFYTIDPADMLLIFDDKDLPFGVVKFREKGSSGGHNGVRDILRVLGTSEIARVKIGVDNAKREYFEKTADFVLSRFSAKERIQLASDIFPVVAQKKDAFLAR